MNQGAASYFFQKLSVAVQLGNPQLFWVVPTQKKKLYIYIYNNNNNNNNNNNKNIFFYDV